MKKNFHICGAFYFRKWKVISDFFFFLLFVISQITRNWSILFTQMKTSFIFRCLPLLAAGSPGRSDTSTSLRPFWAGPVSDIAPRLPGGRQDCVDNIRRHDGCVRPAGVWQSWSAMPQRRRRNTRGLNCRY